MPWLNAEQTIKLCDKWLDYIYNKTYKEALEIGRLYSISRDTIAIVEEIKKQAILYRDVLGRKDVPIKMYSYSSFMTLDNIFSQEEIVGLRSSLSRSLLSSEIQELEERTFLDQIRESEPENYDDESPVGRPSQIIARRPSSGDKCCSSSIGRGLEL